MTVEDQMLDHVLKTAEDKQELVKKGLVKATHNVMVEGMLPKDALAVGSKNMDRMYREAYHLYGTGSYLDAQRLFCTLLAADPTDGKYLFGIAACSHMLKDYEHAAKQYTQSALYDAKNPIPYFHASDCFLELEDKASAMLSLRLVIKRSGNKPEFKVMKDRAQMTLDTIKKEGLKKTKEKQKDEKEDSSPTLEQ